MAPITTPVIYRSGIETILLGKTGAAESTTAFHRIRKGASLIISSMDEAKDYLDRTFPNKLLFKAEVQSMHVNYLGICNALNILISNADIKMKTINGVFEFTNVGCDVELDFNDKDRQIKYSMEYGMNYGDGMTAITTASTASYTPGTDDKINAANYGLGDLDKIYRCDSSGAATADDIIIDKTYFDTWKLTMKTKSNKTAYGRIMPYGLTFGFELSCIGNDLTTLYSLGTMDFVTYGLLLQFNNNTVITNLVFKPGVFNPLPEFEVSEDKRFAKIKYSGGVPINSSSFTMNAGLYATISFNS